VAIYVMPMSWWTASDLPPIETGPFWTALSNVLDVLGILLSSLCSLEAGYPFGSFSPRGW
jgi:hypothetical protein